jgi:arylsulfatase A-like enzyme
VDDSLNYYDYIDRYDAEIRYADEVLGMLIDQLKRKGLWEDAMVVFTADHGEHLGDHTDIIYKRLLNHMCSVWDATAHVPLMIRLPRMHTGQKAVPRRVRGVCSPMDLAPTVLDYLGIEYDVKMDGQSLLPILLDREEKKRVVLLESPLKSYSFIPKGDKNHPDTYAIRSDTHKLIRSFQRGTPNIFAPGSIRHLRGPSGEESVSL